MDTLAIASDLEGFDGAPFDDVLVDSAVAEVRAAAGWHIAPEVTETLTVDSDGGRVLILPTLKAGAITEVRHVPMTGDPVVITDYLRRASGTVLFRWCGWPCGSIEVDLTHGYDNCPPDLFPALADVARSQRTNGRLKSWTKGPFGESYGDGPAGGSALARYTLPKRP